jgi:hypothetical protein
VDALRWLEELRHELARRKLPRRYVKRLVVELSDHITDFMEDSMSTDALESQTIVDRMGMPSQVAQRAAIEYRHQRFPARHPWLAFAALPVVLLPLLWICFAIGVWGLLEAAGSIFGIFGEIPDGPVPRWAEWVILLVVYGTMNLPIVLASWFVCRLANRACVSRKWLALACLVLAVVASSVYPYVAMKTAGRQGLVCFVTPYWNIYPPADPSNVLFVRVPKTARIGQIVQVALPLVAVALSTWRQTSRRRQAMAA